MLNYNIAICIQVEHYQLSSEAKLKMSLSKQNTKTKYCKVCHDTGKDEKTYTSHYVRETPDPTSRIVCPTLLSMECKYCYKKGHTVKHCKIIKSRSQAQERAVRRVNNETKKVSAETVNISKNMYDILECDDDNQVDMNPVATHTPQMFTPRSPTSTPPPTLSYAKIIDITHKQVAEQEMNRIRKEAEEEQEKRKREEQAKTTIASSSYFKPIKIASMLNWADDTSSDEEYAYAEDEN